MFFVEAYLVVSNESYSIMLYYVSDAMIGECVDQIGDTRAHPPTKRNRWGSHGWRLNGYGHHRNYSAYEAEVLGPLNITGQGPLWQPFEFREEEGGYR